MLRPRSKQLYSLGLSSGVAAPCRSIDRKAGCPVLKLCLICADVYMAYPGLQQLFFQSVYVS